MIKLQRFLIIGATKKNDYSAEYNKPTARLTANKPATESHEVYIKLDIELPESLFEKPQLASKIVISEDQCAVHEIDADTMSKIEALASETLGVDLNITVSNGGES